MTANVERWRSLVQQVIAQQNAQVPEGIVLAIIEAESSGTPSAYRGEAAINDGSIGLMQVLGTTAHSLGYTGAPGDRSTLTGLFDPATNIYYGVKLLNGLWTRFGNAADVASAYNGGVRPWLGFGGVLTGDQSKTICLARDANGNCINRVVVQPGQYANAAYVNKVLKLAQQYSGAQQLPTVTIDGSEGSTGAASFGVVLTLAAVGAAALWWAKR